MDGKRFPGSFGRSGNLFFLKGRASCPVFLILRKVKITGLYCLKCYDIMEKSE